MQDDIDAFHAPPPAVNDNINKEDQKEVASDEFGNIILGAPQPEQSIEDIENQAQELETECGAKGTFANFQTRFTLFLREFLRRPDSGIKISSMSSIHVGSEEKVSIT